MLNTISKAEQNR